MPAVRVCLSYQQGSCWNPRCSHEHDSNPWAIECAFSRHYARDSAPCLQERCWFWHWPNARPRAPRGAADLRRQELARAALVNAESKAARYQRRLKALKRHRRQTARLSAKAARLVAAFGRSAAKADRAAAVAREALLRANCSSDLSDSTIDDGGDSSDPDAV